MHRMREPLRAPVTAGATLVAVGAAFAIGLLAGRSGGDEPQRTAPIETLQPSANPVVAALDDGWPALPDLATRPVVGSSGASGSDQPSGPATPPPETTDPPDDPLITVE
jgi:hypothetical protein